MIRKLLIVAFAGMMLTAAGCTEADIQKVDNGTSGNTGASGTSAGAESAGEEPMQEAAAKEETPKEEATPEVFKVGDSVTFDDLIITVNSVRESPGDDFFQPSEGNVFFMVDVTAENTGTEEAAISSMLNTELADSDGYTYNITLTGDVKGSFDGSVGAGRKLRGEVAFEVPKAAAGLEFIFSDPFKTGQAIWKVK